MAYQGDLPMPHGYHTDLDSPGRARETSVSICVSLSIFGVTKSRISTG